ncbi:uncharacterized protein A4U43_C03F7380 [Asparagus officinalis]|uniref:Uncharacterized protein n=1 Tax=Asparagus officinalis TaxID=4686 RepID=A0A5P1F835_ASPOF|nr:uncharacterized protein A4U43_C03F7380 [Asparagus officinalis]
MVILQRAPPRAHKSSLVKLSSLPKAQLQTRSRSHQLPRGASRRSRSADLDQLCEPSLNLDLKPSLDPRANPPICNSADQLRRFATPTPTKPTQLRLVRCHEIRSPIHMRGLVVAVIEEDPLLD